MIDYKVIGSECRDFRKKVLKVTQYDVAKEIYMSRNMISKFECGKVTNSTILLWYYAKGLNLNEVLDKAVKKYV